MDRKRFHNWFLVLFNLAYILIFTFYYISKRNYEFMLYIAVLVVLFVLVVLVQKKIKFTYTILWMLSIWGLLHMLGGGVQVGESVLYRWVPVELYNAHDPGGEFVIIKFDQILHFYIYFVMSFILAHLLIGSNWKIKSSYSYFVIALASIGISVVNELVEFGAIIFLGNTGVGGYYNTLLDLTFNTLGAAVGVVWHSFIRKNN